MSLAVTPVREDATPSTAGVPVSVIAPPAPEAGLDLPVLELVRPMVGFPEHRAFALVRLDEDGVLTSLTSVEDERLRFLVVPPAQFFPDYAPEFGDEVLAEVGISDAADALVLTVLTAGASLAETTANLMAPVLVNVRTRRAAQVVLDDGSLPVAAPLAG